jgi:hypothetical protein
MANVDNSNRNPSDKSNILQNLEFQWPSFQPGVIYADRGYEAETGSSLSGIRVFSPSPDTPDFKSLVETLFKRYRVTIRTDGGVEGSNHAT